MTDTAHTFSTLISPEDLGALMKEPQARLMVFDCSFDLMAPSAGEQQYREKHIPGAVYANLDTALSDKGMPDADGKYHRPADAASGGRHPLPSPEKFAFWLSKVGFANDMQAVVYDRQGNNFCGRLWWMLKWVGHDAVAILDGGLPGWEASGGSVASGEEAAHFQTNFVPGRPLVRLVGTADVLQGLGAPGRTVIDARGAPRYRGDVEPIDPVAGHIPGALNRPFTDNMGKDGRFKSPAELKADFEKILDGRDPTGVVMHCGSGVSAVPNVLAMHLAGLGTPALYAGSWSEWCSDPARPVEKG